MKGSERAAFRAKANSIEPTAYIGKSGITDAVIDSFSKVLSARELVKIKVLPASPMSARECADSLALTAGCDVIQVIGTVAVLYKYNPELHKNEQIKKTVKNPIKQNRSGSRVKTTIKKR